MERDTIDLLKELVAIDSQNPSLVPGAAGEGDAGAAQRAGAQPGQLGSVAANSGTEDGWGRD